MKRILSIFLVVILVFSLTGCQSSAAKAVDEAIADIGNVDLDSAGVIDNARTLFDQLTEEDRKSLKNTDVLLQAEETLRVLQVIDAIDHLPPVDYDVLPELNDVQAMYDALETEEMRSRVTNYNVLKSAFEEYGELVKGKLLIDGSFTLADFYPELNATYGGIPVPVSDGSQRLASVTMIRAKTVEAIPIVAYVRYDRDGNIIGQALQFGTTDMDTLTVTGDIETDDQKRISHFTSHNDDGGYEVYFDYTEDGLSYTSTAGGEIFQERGWDPVMTEVSLDANRVTDWVRFTGRNSKSDKEKEYTEDGLVSKITWNEMLKDGWNTYWKTYSYLYTPGQDGTLSEVRAKDKNGDPAALILSFDEHGCLTYYREIGDGGATGMEFVYRYEPAD